MDAVRLTVEGMELDFAMARGLAQALAAADNPETMLIAWGDRAKGTHSPCCVKCQFGDKPGWEVYGENHGGRLRIDINHGAYVLIYS